MSNIYKAKGEKLVDQYEDVGRLFAHNIQASVAALAKKKSKKSLIRRRVAERVLKNIESKETCLEFLACLSAWSRGAEITIKQAMWLLADNLSGCQTMMVRYGSGVALLHTEEEFIDAHHIKLHLGNPHTIEFEDDVQVSKTLVYNDLLPGSGLYGWKEEMIVAVDSLFLSEEGIDEVASPLLANIVSWLVWRMSPEEITPQRIVKLTESLGELIDGYAMNVVHTKDGKIEGFKLTLMRSEHRVELLGESVGSHLRQVNIVEPDFSGLKWVLSPRKIWRGGWSYFNKRLTRMDGHVQRYRKLAQMWLAVEDLDSIHSTIQSTIFGKLRRSYINPDVGAVCVGVVDERVTSVSCKLNNGDDPGVLEYIDTLNH